MINTHNLTIKGLKKASGETKGLAPYSPEYVEIFYDRATGEVWTKYQFSLGQNAWTRYDDKNVIKICNASSHLTMQKLADMIAERVMEAKAYDD